MPPPVFSNEGKHFGNGFPSSSPSKTFWSEIAAQSLCFCFLFVFLQFRLGRLFFELLDPVSHLVHLLIHPSQMFA